MWLAGRCFMVVIMPPGVHRDVYGSIKRLMCIEQPILSQCVRSKTVYDRFVRVINPHTHQLKPLVLNQTLSLSLCVCVCV